MSILGFFGANDRNKEKMNAERGASKRAKQEWEIYEAERMGKYVFDRQQYEAQVQSNEDNTRFQEREVLENYNQAVKRQNFEFDTATRVYDQSVKQAYNQKAFNKIAESAAYAEQDLKRKDDLLSVMFDEADTILNYNYNTTGLKVDRSNKLVQADFQESRNETKFIGDLGSYEIERRKARSESQIEAQKAILDGMKAAGSIRASGTAGRSSAKAVLGVMAESGALRAAIANGLMYAEQGVDLGIAQLKDMLILDQTMVLAARDAANNEYTLKDSKYDASFDVDKIKISATRQSINQRDAIVRKNIANARRQADMQAEASMMLEPRRLPAITNPAEFYAEYDNPETEDYVEMFVRPEVAEFPEYTPSLRPDYERDFRGTLGRENVASSNFGDILKIGGMAASAVGTLGTAGVIGSAGKIFGIGAGTFSSIGTGLTNFSSSFYPNYSR
jgi:hypothetical protein